VSEDRFRAIHLSGDFFCFPKEAVGWLELWLDSQPVREVRALVEAFYGEKQIETPGIEIEDWVRVFEVGGGSRPG
jgi:hypothetical protein